MIRSFFLIFVLSILMPALTFANGGPVDESFVHKTGEIELRIVENVDILSEDLDITIVGDYCNLEVKYILQNNAGEDVSICYGFPVDFYHPEANYIANSGSNISSTVLFWQDNYIRDFEMIFDGKEVEYTNKIDAETFKDTIWYGSEFTNLEVNIARKWYLAWYLNIRKGNQAELIVRYKIKTEYSDAAYTKSYFTQFSNRMFLYDFSPAQFWGNGSAKKFNIKIDAGEVKDCNGKIEIKGLKNGKEKNGIYTYSYKNFSYKTAPKLELSYDITNKKYSDFIKKKSLKEDYIKQIKITSSNKNINKNVLFDKNYQDAGAVLKKGDWIEIQFPAKYLDFGVIGIINGNTKSENDYYDNAKIKDMQCQFFYNDYQSDKLSDYTITLDSMEVLSYNKFNNSYIYPFMTKLVNSGDWLIRPVKCRLTISDIYPGKKTNDIYIPEIILLGGVI